MESHVMKVPGGGSNIGKSHRWGYHVEGTVGPVIVPQPAEGRRPAPAVPRWT